MVEYYVWACLSIYVSVLAYGIYREHKRDWGENP